MKEENKLYEETKLYKSNHKSITGDRKSKIKNQKSKIVEDLLNNKAKVNIHNNNGNTALHIVKNGLINKKHIFFFHLLFLYLQQMKI